MLALAETQVDNKKSYIGLLSYKESASLSELNIAIDRTSIMAENYQNSVSEQIFNNLSIVC